MAEPVSGEDLEATLEVRNEQGPDIEPGLVDSLAEKIEATVQRRVEQGLQSVEESSKINTKQFAPVVISVVMAEPLSEITGRVGGMPGIILVWVVLILINVIYGIGWFRRGGTR